MTCRSKSYVCLAMRSAAFIKFLPARGAQCRPVGWPRCPWGLGGVCIRPIERHGCRVLMQPGGRDGRDRERFEGNGAQHLMEIGRTQRIEDVAQLVIMERGTA